MEKTCCGQSLREKSIRVPRHNFFHPLCVVCAALNLVNTFSLLLFIFYFVFAFIRDFFGRHYRSKCVASFQDGRLALSTGRDGDAILIFPSFSCDWCFYLFVLNLLPWDDSCNDLHILSFAFAGSRLFLLIFHIWRSVGLKASSYSWHRRPFLVPPRAKCWGQRLENSLCVD